jgi:uncharacterized protein (TIGR00375 family)
MRANLDLHIHSKYSAATSRDMELQEIARGAARKGVKIVGTGDCLFSHWLEEIRRLPESDGLFCLKDTYFVLTVEVEDSQRIHHLILVPDLAKAMELREAFAPASTSLGTDGRPKVRLNGAEIVDVAVEAGCMIGPSHAFTPWTGFYAVHRSLRQGYQERSDKISFIELGLSADSDYADRIAELSTLTFLSNSDAHSPRPNKLGREFTQMEMAGYSFDELRMAILRQKGRHPTLNVGFYPEEGKYNRTACTRCYRQFSAQQIEEMGGRCSCGGLIKLGVRDRVSMLADYPEPRHPAHRPPYLHIIPLAEIIALSFGHRSPYSSAVQKAWQELVEGRTEIEVLVEAELSELEADPRIVEAIDGFRRGRVAVSPGGGGKYGEISLQAGSSQAGSLQAATSQARSLPASSQQAGPKARGGQRSIFDF